MHCRFAVYRISTPLSSSSIKGTFHRSAALSMTESSGFEGKGAISKLGDKKNPKEVTNAEWRTLLTPVQYGVVRESGTEQPHSGKYDKHFKNGNYNCICCGAKLFNSDAKFYSGCGWPSFSKSVDNDLNIVRVKDFSHGMERTEVRCKQCNAHLGHVFDDGPKETGERYCINSCSLDFEKKN